MPIDKQLENLKKGHRFTADADDVVTKKAQSKGGINRARNISMRKECQRMLGMMPEINEATIKQLKRKGMDAEDPSLQTLILARVGALALGKNERVALQAAQLIMELSGNDANSQIAAENRKLQREKLKIERERLELEKNKQDGDSHAEVAKITIRENGDIEVD